MENGADLKFLMDHNRQNWKSVFLLCCCDEIYSVEAVGLKIPIILDKLQFLKNFGQFLEKDYILTITAPLKFESEPSFVHMKLI